MWTALEKRKSSKYLIHSSYCAYHLIRSEISGKLQIKKTCEFFDLVKFLFNYQYASFTDFLQTVCGNVKRTFRINKIYKLPSISNKRLETTFCKNGLDDY